MCIYIYIYICIGSIFLEIDFETDTYNGYFIRFCWMQHPLLMALLTMSIAMLGFGIAKGFRYFIKCQRKSLLEPPVDLFGDTKEEFDDVEAEMNNEKEKHPKYSKAQARQRFKKGKS